MKIERVPHIVHRRRWRLKLGRSSLTVDSQTTVPVTESGVARPSAARSKDLAQIFAPQWPNALPLALHLGHKGLSHVVSQLRRRGFIHGVSPTARQRLLGLRVGHGALVAAGILFDVWQITKAIRRSVAAKSVRPVSAQAARSLTTWGAIWAGVELFGVGGAMLGIELGPGIVITTTAGAVLGGCAGWLAGDWVAERIEMAGGPRSEWSRQDHSAPM